MFTLSATGSGHLTLPWLVWAECENEFELSLCELAPRSRNWQLFLYVLHFWMTAPLFDINKRWLVSEDPAVQLLVSHRIMRTRCASDLFYCQLHNSYNPAVLAVSSHFVSNRIIRTLLYYMVLPPPWRLCFNWLVYLSLCPSVCVSVRWVI